MGEGEDIGRDKPVGERQPAPAIGGPVIGDDEVEIQHQPVERALAEAGSVEEDAPRRTGEFGRDRRRHRRDSRVDRLSEFGGDETAKGGGFHLIHSSLGRRAFTLRIAPR